MAFWEFWAQALKISGNSASSLLEPGVHGMRNPKQPPGEAHMEEIQALPIPQTPPHRASSELPAAGQSQQTALRVRHLERQDSVLSHPSWRYTEQR